jgi:hypothetical protein
MTKNRVAWFYSAIGQFILLKYDPKDIDNEDLELSAEEIALKEQLGPTYRVLIPRPGGRPITLDLTALTHEEFLAFKKFWTWLMDEVEPVVIERDRVAHNAYEAGDDSFSRIYRQAPQLVFREGAIRSDAESVRVRPEDLPAGDVPEGDRVEDLGSRGGGLRGDSDGVVADEPQDPVSQDDEPTTDQP